MRKNYCDTVSEAEGFRDQAEAAAMNGLTLPTP